MTNQIPSDTAARGFTVRTVYCCDICRLEVSDKEKIIQHLAEYHKDTESLNHDDYLVAAAPQQQDNITSSSTMVPLNKSRQKSLCASSTQSDDQVVLQTVDSDPLICPKCGRVYKYLRCFKRHVERHKIDRKLTTPKTVQCRAMYAASQLASDAINSCVTEPKQEHSRDGFTDDPLNNVELEEVTDIQDDVLTNVSDNKLPEEAHELQMAPYCCAECPKRFKTRSSFRLHTIDRHIGWTYVCSLCGQLFLECHELHSHTISDHNKTLNDHDIKLVEPVLNSHRCVVCGFHYRSEAELQNHVACHDDALAAFACSVCSGRYFTESALMSHIQWVHSGDRPYLCELCGVRFATAEERNVHAKQHAPDLCTVCGIRLRCQSYNGTEMDTMTCSVCYLEQLSSRDGVQTAGKDTVTNSVTQRYCQASSLPPKYCCATCGVRFALRISLHCHERKHVLRHVKPSGLQRPSFSCRLCGQQFLWKKNLVRHLQIAHPPSSSYSRVPAATSGCRVFQCEIKPSEDEVPLSENNRMLVPCPECGAEFFWRSSLMRHIRKRHQGNTISSHCRSSEEERLQCNRCGRQFSRLIYLRRHLEAHKNVEKNGGIKAYENEGKSRSEPMLCSKCGKKVIGANNLNIHMLRHSGVRPHQCRLCDRSFFIAAQLKEHVSVVHHGNRFICDQCGHEANSKSALRIHSRFTHPAPGVEPPFPCSICSRRFWSNAALQRHAEAHDLSRLSKRKAMCSVCAMVFRHVYNLTHHIKTTHAAADCATPFACATCHQQFDSGPAFKTHYRSKHRNR